jgi:hypothetical protein
LKLHYAAAVVLAAITIPALAQAESRFRFGVLGGEARTDFTIREDGEPFEDEPQQRALYRHDLGVSAETRLSGPLSLELRGLWTEKGTRFGVVDPDLEGGSADVRLRVGYVAVPLLLKVTKPNGAFRPYAFAGPELGIRRRAQFLTRIGGTSLDVGAEELFHKLDFAARFGAGLEMPRGRMSLFVETSYALGLRNVAKPQLDDAEDAYSIKTRALSVHGGIRF